MDNSPDPSPTDPLRRLLAAVAACGPATAADVAAHAAMAYSTVTPKLRSLEDRGQAERVRVQGRTLWQLTDGSRATLTGPDIASAPGAGSASDSAVATDIPADADTTGTEGEPDAAGAASEDVAGTVAPPDSTSTAPAPATAGPEEDVRPAPSPARAATAAAAAGRRRPGDLRDAALAILQCHPDTTYTVRELCRLIDQNARPGTRKASAGAVSNALDTLDGDGTVTRVNDGPATFRAT